MEVRLFLNAAGIGQDQFAVFLQLHHIEIANGINQLDATCEFVSQTEFFEDVARPGVQWPDHFVVGTGLQKRVDYDVKPLGSVGVFGAVDRH